MVILDRLTNILGTYGVRAVGARHGAGAMVRGVSIHDPAAPAPEQGDVFLAVGVESIEESLRLGRRAEAIAVVTRGAAEDLPDAGHARAAELGLTLLHVDPSVSWSQAAGVVYGLVFEGGETESGRGPSDLPALADAVADSVGSPVTIEDPRFRVLAYSAQPPTTDRARLDTILRRRVSDDLRTHLDRTGVTAHLSASDEPLFVPGSADLGLTPRTTIAVRVGVEFLGSLWVAADRPLDEARRRLLVEGAHSVALHLLRTRVSADLERHVESDLVGRLLEGGIDPTEAVGRLGMAAESYRIIGIQAHTPAERHAALLMTFERVTTGFGWSRPGRSTLFGSTVYTALPCGADPTPAREWAEEIARGLPEHVVVHVGIGGPADPARLAASRREADESLALRATQGDDAPAVIYDESWHEVLVHRLRMASASGRRPQDGPVMGPVTDLARHDTKHGTRYVPTLRAWLHAQGDPTLAAESLGVHPNTIRYRLRRMAETTNLTLDNPRMRLALSIALAVHDDGDDSNGLLGPT
ncbi:helix-turn-helix domain-containing protein [Spiractinospora alimapuensis]|uniref:PucR family transcriptional regulator n=1 Tax=Spiractinospora alimapuensis TaxID=2820884 RepID=UPI001F4523D6|nr:helix-turn-helix domain-containing protein [Spiractinospora alimapuensis]QVQ53276.1 helix-turn-helix domain-containing protein [Spiractinospora alimapuensis]